MGSFHKAECGCGYTKHMQVGGARASYKTESYFPYCCDACGLVDVNVASQKLICPYCHDEAIKEYGKAPMSLANDNRPVIQNFLREAKSGGNFCPKCKNFTLSFSNATSFFD